MVKVLINGINGKMGKEVARLVLEDNALHLLGGLDHKITHNLPYPIFNDVNDILEKPDVIIDFSIPNATINLLPYCVQNTIPLVIATTGFNESEQNEILQASSHIPIFQSANMSYEITLISHIIAKLSKKLPEAEIEIVETHHDQKKDSPSGTALMLANAINKANNNKFLYDFNRMQKCEKRTPNEIGFSSIRGGNIVGEHSILFFSPDETLEIKHCAHSRSIFAKGSIYAAKFLIGKKAGFYNMDNL